MKTALLVLSLALLPGCYTAQKQNILKEEFRAEDARIPLSLTRVTVNDQRSGVESRALRMHETSVEHSDAVSPALTSFHKALIQSEVERYFTPGQKPVAVSVDVTTAKELFEGASMHAKESSEVELKLTFQGSDGQTMFEGWGKANPQVES